MHHRDAVALISAAVPSEGRTWADLGAGSGTFTLALVELVGEGGRVHAVERDAARLAALRRAAGASTGAIVVHEGDFTESLDLPPLDGALLANALHYVPTHVQAAMLARIGALLAPGGRIVVVEYEDRGPNPWVPYPIPLARLRDLAREAGLGPPALAGSRRSRFGGAMYAAWMPPPPRTGA